MLRRANATEVTVAPQPKSSLMGLKKAVKP